MLLASGHMPWPGRSRRLSALATGLSRACLCCRMLGKWLRPGWLRLPRPRRPSRSPTGRTTPTARESHPGEDFCILYFLRRAGHSDRPLGSRQEQEPSHGVGSGSLDPGRRVAHNERKQHAAAEDDDPPKKLRTISSMTASNSRPSHSTATMRPSRNRNRCSVTFSWRR